MTTIKAYNVDTRDFEYVKQNDTGLLISGGGSGGGDASASNQLLQITEAELTNTKLETLNDIFTGSLSVNVDNQIDVSALATGAKQDSMLSDLDSIDVSCNNIEVILDNMGFTMGNLNVSDIATLSELQNSNLAQFTKLELIETGTEINSGYLQTIDLKLTPLQEGVAKYTISATSTLAPDTVPAYKTPPTGVPGTEGWYYKNTSSGNASQLYYYANVASQTKNHDYTISSVQSQWAVVRILNLDVALGLPFLVVYSQPEGSGDHIPGFARSVWVYQIATGQNLRLGEKIVIYRGALPDSRIFPTLRRVECSLSTTSGPGLTSELLAYGTVNTDSGASVGNAEYIISGAGLSFSGDHVYKVELDGTATVAVPGDATASNQTEQLTQSQHSNLAICERLDNLIKCDTDNVTISSGSVSVSGTINVDNWPTNQTVSGDVGLVAGTQIALINSEVGLVAGTSVGLSSGAQVQLISSEVSLTAGTQVQLVSSEVSLTAGTSVNVDNSYIPVTNISGGHLDCYIVNTDQSAPISVNWSTAQQVTETNPIASVFAKLQDGSENSISSTTSEANGNVLNTRLFGYDVANDLVRPVRQGENGGLFVENITSVDFEVVAKNDVKVINATGTALDAHCFGSSDGSTFHHLKTTATGELVTHSQTRDGAGTAITSTVNGAVTALDVAISGTPTVSGLVSTKAQDTFAPQVLTNTGVTGPVQIGTVADIQGYLWVSALLTFTSVTAGGQIYIEVSPDNSNWARPSASSVFVMSSGSSVTASILLGVPVAMRYVRLYADSPFVGLGCNAFISCK